MKILEDMILERGIAVNEDILKAYLAENNMPLVAGEEQDVLAVPLLEKEDGTLDLWSDENIWRQAFQQRRDIRKGNLVIRDIEKDLESMSKKDLQQLRKKLTKQMHAAAAELNFELAATLRDQMMKVVQQLNE